MRTIIIYLFVITVCVACSTNDKQKKLVAINSVVDQSNDYRDIVLEIVKKQETESAFFYNVEGLYNGDTVGLGISLKKGLKAGIVNGEMKNVFVTNGITFSSIGAKSNKLLASMATIYGIDSIGAEMKNEPIIMSCANLNQQNINYSSGEYRFKVFMESEDDNSELFVVFDFTHNLIYLNEKDPGYRKGVLLYLMKK